MVRPRGMGPAPEGPSRLRTIALSAPLRLVWTVLAYVGVNALLNRLGIARTGSASVTWVYRNAVVALAVLWFSVLLERKGLAAAGLGLRPAARGLGLGFLTGAGIVSAIVGILAIAGAYRVQGLWPLDPGTSRWALFAFYILGFFMVGFAEEIRSRGLLFRLLEQNLGTWIAMGLSALYFGFSHLQNQNATVWSSVAIAIEGGVLLAALYAATRNLWVPIGIHWAWNLFEGPVFGTVISGNAVGALLRPSVSGGAWLTGGPFGPEAGVPSLVVGTVLGGLAVVWMIRRGGVVPGPWVHWRRAPVSPELGPGKPVEPVGPEATGGVRPGA